eukprot:6191521-Pleurochrysis_carterae.AAC.1
MDRTLIYKNCCWLVFQCSSRPLLLGCFSALLYALVLVSSRVSSSCVSPVISFPTHPFNSPLSLAPRPSSNDLFDLECKNAPHLVSHRRAAAACRRIRAREAHTDADGEQNQDAGLSDADPLYLGGLPPLTASVPCFPSPSLVPPPNSPFLPPLIPGLPTSSCTDTASLCPFLALVARSPPPLHSIPHRC